MKIFIFHAEAGYGHKKVAQVIVRTFLDRGLAPDMVHLEDALEFCPWVFRKSYPAVYFYSVKHIPKIWGWFYETLDREPYASWIRPWRGTANRLNGAKLLSRMQKENPDVILCTHFFSAELFARAKREGKLQAKLVTVITDFFPHSFWVNEGTDLYWVMAEETARDLYRRGVPKERVIAGGIPIEKKFHPNGGRSVLLRSWGLADNRFTVVLTMGSFGLGPQLDILKAMEKFSTSIQCLVVCGQNESMKQELEGQTFGYPVKIFGFVDFMPDLMEAGDLLIAKSGGSTTTESLAKGIPMVIMQPIPGQETRNARLMKDRNAAFFIKDPEEIRIILKNIFDHPMLLSEKRLAIRSLAKPHAAEDLVSHLLGKNSP